MQSAAKRVLDDNRINATLRFIVRNRIRISQILVGILVLGLLFDFWSFTPVSGPLGIIAVIVIGAGVGFRSWSAGIIRKNKTLATRGPYALTRHPLYLGSFLMATGFLVIFRDTALTLVVITAFVVIYFPAILREEYKMYRKFPRQWTRYINKVAMFFPKKVTLSSLRAGWSFRQWRKNGEYRNFSTVLFSVIILCLL